MSASSGNWPHLALSEVCNILAGYGFPEALQGNTDGDLPFFKVGDISETWKRGDTFLSRANHYISFEEARTIRAKPLPTHTTVFAKIGAAIALNRRAILSKPSLVDNNVMGLHPIRSDLDFKFLYHFVCTLKLDELSRATTVPSIRKSDIEQIQIPFPPHAEQQRIVAETEKQFTRLDAGVAALKRAQANLKRYRAAVLKAACEGKLVPTEAELARAEGRGYESGAELLQRILSERRAKWAGRGKYKEPVAPNVEGLAALPEGWVWASLDQVASHLTSGSRAWSQFYGKGEDIFILAQNVRPMKLDLSDPQHVLAPRGDLETERTRVQIEDLLITIVGANTGDICRANLPLLDHFVCQSVALVRLALRNVSQFVEVYLASPENGQSQWQKDIYGQGRPHLSFEQLRVTAIALPPLAEQHRIVAEVERRLSVIEEMEAAASANLRRAGRLRQAVLQRAFSGQL